MYIGTIFDKYNKSEEKKTMLKMKTPIRISMADSKKKIRISWTLQNVIPWMDL